MNVICVPDPMWELTQFKQDAIEQLAENERHIDSLAKRIKELEKCINYLRAHMFDMYKNTVDVVPINYVTDEKPKKYKNTKTTT